MSGREAEVPRDLRQIHNRELFRATNDQIADLVSRYAVLDGGTEIFICECSQLGCTEQLAVPLEVYARVRETEGAYLVLAGHEDPESEQTVFGHGGYLIVIGNANHQAAAGPRQPELGGTSSRGAMRGRARRSSVS